MASNNALFEIGPFKNRWKPALLKTVLNRWACGNFSSLFLLGVSMVTVCVGDEFLVMRSSMY